MQKLLKQDYPDLQDYDLLASLNRSNPIKLVIFEHAYGVLFLALSKRLFAFKGAQLYDLLTGKVEKNIKEFVDFSLSFEKDIDCLRISKENELMVVTGSTIHFYRVSELVQERSNVEICRQITIPGNLGDGEFVRQISENPSGKNNCG